MSARFAGGVLYGYATGVFSSRKLALKLHEDIAFRVLVAGNFPAHRALTDFRAFHLEELAQLFVQVLQLTMECGVVKLAQVAIDGTKIKANASRHKAMGYKRMKEEEAKLKGQVADLLNRAGAVDHAERDEPELDILAEIARREKRLAKIAAAKERLEKSQREAGEAKGRHKDDEQQPRHPDGKAKRGARYKRPFGVPEDKAQRSFTDADSRIMQHSHGGFEQSYNNQLLLMLGAVERNTGRLPEQTLADAGYRSEEVLVALDGVGTDALIALVRHAPCFLC